MAGTNQAMGTATTSSADQQKPPIGEGRYVRANGTDIYYVEAGRGEPLLLLHGGGVSTGPAWAGSPVAWVPQMETFARHFRVVAPDTRGCGRTANPGGDPILYSQLADDVVALSAALGLERPLICGFSDGAVTATVASLRHLGAVRAIVNYAGYDLFSSNAEHFAMIRQVFGGRPDATSADPEAIERMFDSSDQMRDYLARLRADFDGAQGPGYWKTHFAEAFERYTQTPGCTLDDLSGITVPTLILVGDRDQFCSLEEGIAAYRRLPVGEMAVVPGTGHWITSSSVQIALDFLRRHAISGSGSTG